MTVTDSPADHLEGLRERLVSLTRDMILIPSCATRPDDIDRCFEFILNHIEGLEGIEIERHCHEGCPSITVLPSGNRRPEVLLCAHLDVIAHASPGVYHSWVKDGRIHGPGAGDMKGALAILLELFHAWHGRRPGLALGLAITSDEERGGMAGMHYLFEEVGLRCGAAIIPDGGSIDEVTIQEKGIIHLRARCEGASAHAARPWLGDNALERLNGRLDKLLKSFERYETDGEDRWHPTCSLTILGTPNESINRVPQHAQAVLDIRFTPPWTVDSMLAEVRQALGDGIDTEVIISAESSHLDPEPHYLEVIEEITGSPPQLIRSHGGSDARFIRAHGLPVMVSRPLVGDLHAEREWIDIDSMVTFYRILDRYVDRRISQANAAP